MPRRLPYGTRALMVLTISVITTNFQTGTIGMIGSKVLGSPEITIIKVITMLLTTTFHNLLEIALVNR
jgi:hypothetical protein